MQSGELSTRGVLFCKRGTKGKGGRFVMIFRDRQQIVICAAAAAMICGFVLLRYLPLQEGMKALRQAHAVQMFAVSKVSAECQQMPAIKEQLQQLRTEVENYDRQIPAQRELGEFLQKIADLMNEHNLQGQMVQVGEEIKAGELNCVPVSMQCRGRD